MDTPPPSQSGLPGLIPAQVGPGVSRVLQDLLQLSVLLIGVILSQWQTLI